MNVTLCEICGEHHEIGFCPKGWELPDPKPPREVKPTSALSRSMPSEYRRRAHKDD